MLYRVYGWRRLVKATKVTVGLAESNGTLSPGISSGNVFESRLPRCRVTTLGKLFTSHPCASVNKQYNLVLVDGSDDLWLER